jgi:hypothetical protein
MDNRLGFIFAAGFFQLTRVPSPLSPPLISEITGDPNQAAIFNVVIWNNFSLKSTKIFAEDPVFGTRDLEIISDPGGPEDGT